MTEFEQSLSALAPSQGRFDRDRLMYEAGRRSVLNKPRRWIWPALAASLAVVAAGQTVALRLLPASRVVERVVIVREPSVEPARSVEPVVILSRRDEVRQPRPFEGAATASYLQLNRQVERFGLDGLPEPPLLTLSAGGDGASALPVEAPRMLHDYLLDELTNIGGPS